MRRVVLTCLVALAACKRGPPPATPPAPRWQWKSPLPQGNTLHDVFSPDGSRVYAVGEAGTILRSDDGGASFTLLPAPTRAALLGVTGDGGGLIVVGAGGAILGSSDGRTFAPMTSPTTETLEAVWANGHGRIFAVGARGTILRSTDGGATWTPVISKVTVTLRAIRGTVHDDLFAVGDGGTFLLAEDNAPVWERREAGTTEDLSSIWVGPRGELIVAGGTTALRSDDKGTTFAPLSTGKGLLAVGGSAGEVWLAGTGGTMLRSRDAGRTFAPVESPLAQTFTAVAPVRGGAVLAGTFGAVVRVADGGPALSTPGPRARLSAVTACGGDLFAVGVDGTLLAARGPGPFTPVATGVRGELTAVTCDGAEPIAVGAGGAMLRGVPPKSVPSGGERLLTGVAAAAGHVVAVADDGSVLEDGRVAASADRPLRAVWFDGASGVAVGDGGTVALRGLDGWRVMPGVAAFDLRAVAGLGRTVWAAGARGTALRSSDAGLTWQVVKLGTDADLLAVAVAPGDRAVLCGEHGTLVRVAAGGAATLEDSGTVNDLLGVAIGASQVVVVGAGGTILAASPRDP